MKELKMTNDKQSIWVRVLLGASALIILMFTLPAYLDSANNPGLANLTGETATLGSVAGAFLGRQLVIALIGLYGAVNGTSQPVLIGAFGLAFFNLHDALLLSVFGNGGPGAIAGLVIGLLGLCVMWLAYRRAKQSS
jgi:hypothetical protein